MNLPRGYKKQNFVADPHGRANHLHHPKTDEVFHVDAETYKAIVKPDQDSVDADALEIAEVETDAQTGMTLSLEPADADEAKETEQEAGDAQTPLAHDLAELKAMADGLGLELAEGATPEEIQAAVHAAVGGVL